MIALPWEEKAETGHKSFLIYSGLQQIPAPAPEALTKEVGQARIFRVQLLQQLDLEPESPSFTWFQRGVEAELNYFSIMRLTLVLSSC